MFKLLIIIIVRKKKDSYSTFRCVLNSQDGEKNDRIVGIKKELESYTASDRGEKKEREKLK